MGRARCPPEAFGGGRRRGALLPPRPSSQRSVGGTGRQSVPPDSRHRDRARFSAFLCVRPPPVASPSPPARDADAGRLTGERRERHPRPLTRKQSRPGRSPPVAEVRRCGAGADGRRRACGVGTLIHGDELPGFILCPARRGRGRSRRRGRGTAMRTPRGVNDGERR